MGELHTSQWSFSLTIEDQKLVYSMNDSPYTPGAFQTANGQATPTNCLVPSRPPHFNRRCSKGLQVARNHSHQLLSLPWCLECFLGLWKFGPCTPAIHMCIASRQLCASSKFPGRSEALWDFLPNAMSCNTGEAELNPFLGTRINLDLFLDLLA